jgi:hypothetical protein
VDRAAVTGIESPARGIYQEKPIAGQQAARSSRCAVTADFTRKGRLDIVTNNFNDRPYFSRISRRQRTSLSFGYVAPRAIATRSAP